MQTNLTVSCSTIATCGIDQCTEVKDSIDSVVLEPLFLNSRLTNFDTYFNYDSLRDPVYREEEESFTSWWAKTPLGRRYQKSLEVEAQLKLEKESGADKKRRK